MKDTIKCFSNKYKKLFEGQSWSLYMYVTSCFAIISHLWLDGVNGASSFTVMLLFSICSFMTVGLGKCLVRGTKREPTYTLLLDFICTVLVLIATVINAREMFTSIAFISIMQFLCRIGDTNRNNSICLKISKTVLVISIFGCTILFFAFLCRLKMPIWLKIFVPIVHLTTIPFLVRLQEKAGYTVGEMLFSIEYEDINRYKF